MSTINRFPDAHCSGTSFEADQNRLCWLHRETSSVQPRFDDLTSGFAIDSFVRNSCPVPEDRKQYELSDAADCVVLENSQSFRGVGGRRGEPLDARLLVSGIVLDVDSLGSPVHSRKVELTVDDSNSCESFALINTVGGVVCRIAGQFDNSSVLSGTDSFIDHDRSVVRGLNCRSVLLTSDRDRLDQVVPVARLMSVHTRIVSSPRNSLESDAFMEEHSCHTIRRSVESPVQ